MSSSHGRERTCENVVWRPPCWDLQEEKKEKDGCGQHQVLSGGLLFRSSAGLTQLIFWLWNGNAHWGGWALDLGRCQSGALRFYPWSSHCCPWSLTLQQGSRFTAAYAQVAPLFWPPTVLPLQIFWSKPFACTWLGPWVEALLHCDSEWGGGEVFSQIGVWLIDGMSQTL